MHNLALPVFMAALAALLSGNPGAGPVVGIGSLVMFAGLLLFGINVLVNVRAPA